MTKPKSITLAAVLVVLYGAFCCWFISRRA